MTSHAHCSSSKRIARPRLRCGFSTGTAATGAARAALRHCLTGVPSRVVAVRLPANYYICVPVLESRLRDGIASATVIKDGGDDPDVTHKAELIATVSPAFCHLSSVDPKDPVSQSHSDKMSGIWLVAGEGVGIVTKPGLPVKVGEPAINPVPRDMLARNLTEELLQRSIPTIAEPDRCTNRNRELKPHIFLPFIDGGKCPANLSLEVEISVPKGLELAKRTLNPRLGVRDGISILGTTGLVKPFSHEAYRETIEVALNVATSNGCSEIVFSTGGKSEKLARKNLPHLPAESFVQIADYFSFAVREAAKMGFKLAIHSVFFGKAVKMAQGHPYTHAHRVPLDLRSVAELAQSHGYGHQFCHELTAANTASHALEFLLNHGAGDIVVDVAWKALEQSKRIAGNSFGVRLLLFHHDGTLLADVRDE